MRLLALAIALATMTPAFAHADTRPDAHAPIGVMGDHMHNKGEWMLSYRFMDMSMDGNRSGTSSVSTQQVLDHYMVAPTSMDMKMHMFGLMAAPWQRCTLMLMAPYILKSMDHVDGMGMASTMETSGFGDMALTGLIRLAAPGTGRLQATVGVSIPTGSIDESGAMVHMGQSHTGRLPYPMQLGSGTWDPILGLTWASACSRWSWGAQATTVLRVSENDNDYHLGNQYDGGGWAALVLNDWVSVSGRLVASRRENIDGADPALSPMMVPTADPNLRAGTYLDGAAGVNFIVPHGTLQGLRVAVEYLAPFYQDLNGPQLETDWTVVAGVQYAGSF